MIRMLRKVSAIVVMTSIASAASAGGLYIREFGHPMQGASNAGAGAIVQDASTAITNPAGTAQLEESEWMVAGIGIYSKIEFEQQPGTTVPGNNGGDAGGFAPGASLFYARPFGEKFGFGFAFNALSGAVIEYDSGFVGRYWAEKVDLLVVAAAPSIAGRSTISGACRSACRSRTARSISMSRSRR